MMRSDDSEYYRRRAASERSLAQAAVDPRIAAIHDELAERYDLLANEDQWPTLQTLTDESEAA